MPDPIDPSVHSSTLSRQSSVSSFSSSGSSASAASQRPVREGDRTGYAALPGSPHAGSTASQLQERARRDGGTGRLQRRSAPTEKDEPRAAVIQPHDTNQAFALLQTAQTISQTAGSIPQGAQQFASAVGSEAQQLMGIISNSVR